MKLITRALFVTIIALLIPYSLFSLDDKGFHAYPVPFNPKKGVLTIDKDPAVLTGYKTKLEIFDINSDLVCVREYSDFPNDGIVWNGRNDRGEFVKPGMYILKLTLENSINGDYGKKIIKIIVKY